MEALLFTPYSPGRECYVFFVCVRVCVYICIRYFLLKYNGCTSLRGEHHLPYYSPRYKGFLFSLKAASPSSLSLVPMTRE